MGIVALVLVHLDQTDNIRRDQDFGQKTAQALLSLGRSSRKKIAIRNGVGTVMSAHCSDTAIVRVHGGAADRLTTEEEIVVEQALARLRKKNKTTNASRRIASAE